MRLPRFLLRRWTAGRVVGLFDGWGLAEGTMALVSLAQAHGAKPELKVTLVRRGSGEAATGGACLCPACLAESDWPEVARSIMDGLAGSLAPNPFVFTVSAPAPASVDAN